MTLRVGESGKDLRFATSFDMSSNTELTLDFILPDQTTLQKTSADGVVIGSVAVTDPTLGALLANQYAVYPIEAGVLTQAGVWKVRLTYTDTVPAPDDVFISDYKNITVVAAT